MTHDFKDASFILPEDVKEKWLAALRSGEYKQCGGQLYDGEGYCCLGVLEKVATGKVIHGEAGYLSDKTCEKIGALFGYMSDELQITNSPLFRIGSCHLTEYNDSGGTFAEIADLIEDGVGTYKREV